MDDAAILTALKVDLQISTDAADSAYFLPLIQTAKEYIATEGIVLDESSEGDGMLVVMYAAYLYRSRTNDTGMPRMLRYALNNRLFAQKGTPTADA
jgi:hypothetical protein